MRRLKGETVLWRCRGVRDIRYGAILAIAEKWGGFASAGILLLIVAGELPAYVPIEANLDRIGTILVAALALAITGAWAFQTHSVETLPVVTDSAIYFVDSRLAALRPILRIGWDSLEKVEVTERGSPVRAIGLEIIAEPRIRILRGYAESARLPAADLDEFARILAKRTQMAAGRRMPILL